MTLELLRFKDSNQMAWRNGGGLTHEILREPSEAIADEFDWRISVADIAGPASFSRLEGVDRMILLAEGARMRLSVDRQAVELIRWKPYYFSGESQTFCDVPEGHTRDVNVMSNRQRIVVKARLVDVSGHHVVLLRSNEAALVALTNGVVAHSRPPFEAVELAKFDALRIRAAQKVQLSQHGKLLQVEVWRKNLATCRETEPRAPQPGTM